MGKRADGELVFSLGITRSGKTTFLKSQPAIKWAARLIAWDPKGSFVDLFPHGSNQPVIVHSIAELLQVVESSPASRRIIYRPMPSEETTATFSIFCEIAFVWSVQSPAVVLAEELAKVSSPGKSSGGWLKLVSQGLEYGTKIYAVAQRPQEIDKTVMSAATTINVCQMSRDADVEWLREFGLTPDDVPGCRREMVTVTRERAILYAKTAISRHGGFYLRELRWPTYTYAENGERQLRARESLAAERREWAGG